MRITKKILALTLALLMIFSLAATASAASTGSITIQGTVNGKSYDLYKIFDLTYDVTDNTKVAYTIDPDWAAFFNGAGSSYIVDTNTGNLNAIVVKVTEEGVEKDVVKYINITESNIAAFADAALAYAVTTNVETTATGNGGNVTVSNLPLGYYLVYPRGATEVTDTYVCICSLTSTNPNATVAVKATYPTIDKTADKVDMDLGETVKFEVTGKVPETTGFNLFYIYKISDRMSEGLTFNKDVKVYVDGTELTENFTINYDVNNGFDVTIDVLKLQANVGDVISVQYSAVINEKAVVTGANNSATLTYSNNPSDDDSTATPPPVVKKVYSSKIEILKVDSENNSKTLAGAEFVLMNSEGKYYNLTDGVVTWKDSETDATKIVTGNDGIGTFSGLANGTYTLKETKAPGGYNLLTETVEVEIQGDDTNGVGVTAKSTIENNSGFLLIGTGGIGTTIFYIVGGLMVFAAVVLLITKKRMSNAE